MRCVDVNILVYAHRPESPGHHEVRAWLETQRRGREPLGIPGVVESGFLRVVTHPRIFKEPTPLTTAMDFLEAVRGSPAVTSVEPGGRHWEIFSGLCRSLGLRGNDIPDAYLAALAMEHGCTWVTADRGFTRFPDLRVEHPTNDQRG